MSAIARAVLYEGYILWPYRRSAVKNTQRWTFGGVFPDAWTYAHPDDPSILESQVLVEGPPTVEVEIALRFLHVVDRRLTDSSGAFVDELHAGGERHLAWQEACEREVAVPARAFESLLLPFAFPAGNEEEPLGDAGAVVRSWATVEGTIEVRAESLEPDLQRVTLRVHNGSAWSGEERSEALRHSLVSTHLALRVDGGAFVSLTDPPEPLREAAGACVNSGTWPILAGEEGDRSALLCSPIILEDHPQIAPESPGDLFDGGEIDQLLVLNILSLSDEEKAEMRDSDPKAREILDRCASLSRDDLMRLHGTIREFGPGALP